MHRHLAGSRERRSLHDLARAEAEIDRDLESKRTADHLAAAGVARLLQNKPNEAIFLFKEAVGAIAEARLWSDLSAAYYVRGEREGAAVDFAHAVSAAERSIELRPTLEEAWFNFAYALEKLYLFREARVAWCEAARRATGEEWIRESRKECLSSSPVSVPELWKNQRASLDQAALRGNEAVVRLIVAGNTQASREHVLDELLAQWGDAILAGRTREASDALQVARVIGKALQQETREFTVADSVRAIDDAEQGQLLLTAQVYRDYSVGRRLYQNFDIERAAPLLEKVAVAWNRSRNPIGLWARLWQSGIALYKAHYEEAVGRLHGILGTAEISRYPSLAGLSHWLLGVVHLRTGRLAEALEHYREAVPLLQSVREEQNLGGIYSLTSEVLDYLGQAQVSWNYRYRALEVLHRYPSSIQLQNLLRDSARVSLAASDPHAALYFQNECVRTAEASGNAVVTTDALIQRSRIEERLQRITAARSDLQAGLRQRDRIPGATLRERLTFDIATIEGELEAKTNTTRSLQLLSSAINYYSSKKLDINLAPVLLARARRWIAVGSEEKAEVDLRRGIELFEGQRRMIVDRDLRLSILQTAVDLFDEMILLQVERRHDSSVALDYAERARSVLSRLGGSLSAAVLPPSVPNSIVSQIHKALAKYPFPVVVVEYALVHDRLFIWRIDRQDVRFIQRAINAEALSKDTNRFLVGLRQNASAEELAGVSSVLFDQLIAPYVAGLPQEADLIIVPDKFLNALPFAALRNRRSGQYLIELHPLALMPQAALLTDIPSQRRKGSSADAHNALLIDNPAFNRSKFPWLSALPNADREISRIAPLYFHPTILRGAEATSSYFFQALKGAKVLHFAGHALANAMDPSDAQLIFATSPGAMSADTISVRELHDNVFSSLRLVVLSACNTAVPDASRSGGLFGLARPFLEGGVEAVVGTLWSADDRTALELLPAFHRDYLKTGSAVRALRQAQLKLIHNRVSSSPAGWAAFCVIEGN
jgi:CHAT domain-containing protein/Flp pilus assembly protein TadD